MCDCHSILECCVVFSGVTLSIRSFNLFLESLLFHYIVIDIGYNEKNRILSYYNGIISILLPWK